MHEHRRKARGARSRRTDLTGAGGFGAALTGVLELELAAAEGAAEAACIFARRLSLICTRLSSSTSTRPGRGSSHLVRIGLGIGASLLRWPVFVHAVRHGCLVAVATRVVVVTSSTSRGGAD